MIITDKSDTLTVDESMVLGECNRGGCNTVTSSNCTTNIVCKPSQNSSVCRASRYSKVVRRCSTLRDDNIQFVIYLSTNSISLECGFWGI